MAPDKEVGAALCALVERGAGVQLLDPVLELLPVFLSGREW